MITRQEIQIRDPFVVVQDGYWMFGTTDPDPWKAPGLGFDAYRSTDLETFEGPFPAFRPDSSFWAERNFWAPEVHRYHDAFYMFASFFAEGRRRGTQILKSTAINGPYQPISAGPVTPGDWECLDGTLWVEDGLPWIVFCHEWTQIGVGTVCALPLAPDLSAPAALNDSGGQHAQPVTLFPGDSAPWARSVTKEHHFVTDGPFLFRTKAGVLLMIWSGFGEGGYTVGIAESESGNILGPWKQQPQPLFSADGGHGMIFRAHTGELYLSLHSPNETPAERPRFIRIQDTGTSLRVAQ